MKRLFSLGLLIIFVISFSLYYVLGSEKIHLNESTSLKIETKQLRIKAMKKEERKVLDIHEETRSFIISNIKKVGYLSITTRTLSNGDIFIFHRLRAIGDQTVDVTLSINGKVLSFNDWNPTEKEVVHHKNFGEDPTRNPIGIYKLKNNREILQGHTFLSSEKSKNYPEGTKSILRELVEEENTLKENKNEISIDLASKNGIIAETWSLISQEPLFSSREHEDKWIEYSTSHPTEVNNWFTQDGPYHKLPWSIEPYTKMGYGRNLGSTQDDISLSLYKKEKERLHYNLVWNSVFDLIKFREQKGTKLWETEYTSTWLKKAYGTEAPYIDTRHNEYIALFLSDVGGTFNVDELNQAVLTYGDYLLNQVTLQNYIEVKRYPLISDYYSPYNTSKKTHSSLNHVLGGINILLDCYSLTKNEKYLFTATKMIDAIEVLGDQWVRESDDLWYQVNEDLTFSGNDYEQLTLIDLLNTQKKLFENQLTTSDTLQLLIDKKLSYLLNQNKELHPKVIELIQE